MISKLTAIALLAGTALLSLPGCAADTSSNDDQDESNESQDEIKANAAKLVDTFNQDGASISYPAITNIIFHDNGVFSADVDTGIRCVRAPCPSGQHFAGHYSATKSYVTLDPMTKTSPQTEYHGKYKYVLEGNKLTLTRKDFSASWKNTFDREPVAEIFPANATQLVARQAGGGFRPPPPAGSTCNGGEKFTLDIAAKKLSWEVCDFAAGAPQHLVTGNRTISSKELSDIVASAKALKTAAGDMCGADKPLEQVDVATPSGSKTYTDSFYSCWGGKYEFVDNIGGVFQAMRAAMK